MIEIFLIIYSMNLLKLVNTKVCLPCVSTEHFITSSWRYLINPKIWKEVSKNTLIASKRLTSKILNLIKLIEKCITWYKKYCNFSNQEEKNTKNLRVVKNCSYGVSIFLISRCPVETFTSDLNIGTKLLWQSDWPFLWFCIFHSFCFISFFQFNFVILSHFNKILTDGNGTEKFFQWFLSKEKSYFLRNIFDKNVL